MIHSVIVTERLTLRPLRIDDAAETVEVLADVSVYEFIGGEPPTLEALQDRYSRQLAGSPEPTESWLNWIIRTNAGDRAVGFVQATVAGNKADLAWLVGVGDQHSGFATEAAIAANAWLVGCGVQEVEAHIDRSHVASQSVARRIGMSPTGTFDADGEELWAADFYAASDKPD